MNNSNGPSSPAASRVHHFKLVLLGDTAVGKSCLVVRFVRDEFFEFQEPTIGGTSHHCCRDVDKWLFSRLIRGWEMKGDVVHLYVVFYLAYNCPNHDESRSRYC